MQPLAFIDNTNFLLVITLNSLPTYLLNLAGIKKYHVKYKPMIFPSEYFVRYFHRKDHGSNQVEYKFVLANHLYLHETCTCDNTSQSYFHSKSLAFT